jgi:hypothetical protein
LGDTEEHSERRGSNTSDVITAPSRDDVHLDVLEGSINNSENSNGETHSNNDIENGVVGDKEVVKGEGVEDADKIVQEMKDGKGGEGENMSLNTSVSTSTRTPAMRTLIVLFDNTYSWYQPKELK